MLNSKSKAPSKQSHHRYPPHKPGAQPRQWSASTSVAFADINSLALATTWATSEKMLS